MLVHRTIDDIEFPLLNLELEQDFKDVSDSEGGDPMKTTLLCEQ